MHDSFLVEVRECQSDIVGEVELYMQRCGFLDPLQEVSEALLHQFHGENRETRGRVARNSVILHQAGVGEGNEWPHCPVHSCYVKPGTVTVLRRQVKQFGGTLPLSIAPSVHCTKPSPTHALVTAQLQGDQDSDLSRADISGRLLYKEKMYRY